MPVTEQFDLQRYQAIESVIEGLHSQLDKYRSASYECPMNGSQSFSCGSFMLGSLTKEMESSDLLKPRPEVSFSDLSFYGVCKKVRAFKSPTWVLPDSNGYYSQQHL
jgi:hypothetical protein